MLIASCKFPFHHWLSSSFSHQTWDAQSLKWLAESHENSRDFVLLAIFESATLVEELSSITNNECHHQLIGYCWMCSEHYQSPSNLLTRVNHSELVKRMLKTIIWVYNQHKALQVFTTTHYPPVTSNNARNNWLLNPYLNPLGFLIQTFHPLWVNHQVRGHWQWTAYWLLHC